MSLRYLQSLRSHLNRFAKHFGMTSHSDLRANRRLVAVT